MVRGKTESGFEFEIDEMELNDYLFVKLLANAQDDVLAFTKVVNRLLGDEQEAKLIDHLKDEKGHVPMETLGEAVTEIMTLAGENVKNS